jgi:hypothetical protein
LKKKLTGLSDFRDEPYGGELKSKIKNQKWWGLSPKLRVSVSLWPKSFEPLWLGGYQPNAQPGDRIPETEQTGKPIEQMSLGPACRH